MSRLKHIFTPAQDALLLAHYDGHRHHLPALYRRLPFPTWAVRKRAKVLGLARTKEPRWTAAQEAFLTQHIGTMPWDEMGRRLGRTKIAVKLHTKRMGLRKTKIGLTALSVARLLGCDGHRVTYWIQRGWLSARSRGTDPHPSRGTIYFITPNAVRRFVIVHPEEIDLRRVDKLWFIDLLIGRFEQAGTVLHDAGLIAPATIARLDRALQEVIT